MRFFFLNDVFKGVFLCEKVEKGTFFVSKIVSIRGTIRLVLSSHVFALEIGRNADVVLHRRLEIAVPHPERYLIGDDAGFCSFYSEMFVPQT